MVHRIEAGEIDADAAAALLGQSGVDGAAVDHVGIATDAIGATLEFFAGVLELPVGEPEDVAAQHVRVRFVETGDARLELVEATDQESRFAASLRTRGPGLHHLALRVADLEASLARLSACGVRLIDAVPRPGAHGTRVAFVHPASTRGVLVELVERTGRVPYR
jgi:methylmalonyl-CoA epimerase